MSLAQNVAKIANKFVCNNCDYRTSNKTDFIKHSLTRKHIFRTNSNKFECKISQSNILTCKCCQKKYTSKSGLWYHEQRCTKSKSITNNLENTLIPISSTDLPENKSLDVMKEMMMEMFRSNNELKTALLEMAKEPKVINNITQTNQNTQNNQNNFNLQLFLNEKCKDAITANQFADNIEISMSDLHNVGNKGYVEGLSQIIINELRKMDITKRPFHCTDLKREVIYIKDEDAWNKDNEDKSKLKVMIGQVAGKNLNKLYEWQAEHPEFLILDSDEYSMNHKLLYNAHGGLTELSVLKDKVIKLIAKEVHLDKVNNSTLIN